MLTAWIEGLRVYSNFDFLEQVGTLQTRIYVKRHTPRGMEKRAKNINILTSLTRIYIERHCNEIIALLLNVDVERLSCDSF